MLRFAKIILFLATTSIGFAGEPEWAFTWVSSTGAAHEVVQGKANLSINGDKVSGVLHGADGEECQIQGSIKRHQVRIKFTVVGSDHFINSPFTGSYMIKRWRGIKGSSGRESITLSDGWNMLGFTHEIP